MGSESRDGLLQLKYLIPDGVSVEVIKPQQIVGSASRDLMLGMEAGIAIVKELNRANIKAVRSDLFHDVESTAFRCHKIPSDRSRAQLSSGLEQDQMLGIRWRGFRLDRFPIWGLNNSVEV